MKLALTLLVALTAIAVDKTSATSLYYTELGDLEDNDMNEIENYADEPLEDILQDNVSKRGSRQHLQIYGCVKRFGNCDHRPHSCCFKSSCRCNIWGGNCRCERMGLFQKWG